jgi:hypothetical protein
MEMTEPLTPEDLAGLETRWVGAVPLARIRPMASKILPPGDWILLREFVEKLNEMSRILKSMMSRTYSGRQLVVISRDLDEMALAELPTRKPNLDGNSGATRDGDMVDLFGSGKVVTASIQVARNLLDDIQKGTVVGAEEFLSALMSSPDPGLTSQVLGIAGKDVEPIHSDDESINLGASPSFPVTLETDRLFSLQLHSFVEHNENSVRAKVNLLHEPHESDIIFASAFKTNGHIPVSFAAIEDKVLFRMMAAARLPIDVRASATISSTTRLVQRLTVRGFIDRTQSLESLQLLVRQLALPLKDELPLPAD